MEDLLQEQVEILKGRLSSFYSVESLLTEAIDWDHMEELHDEVFADILAAYNYIKGAADALDMTMIEVLDHFGLDYK